MPEIVRELGNWRVACWLGRVPHPYVPRHARTWLAFYRQQREAGRDLSLAVALRARPERMIGMIGCHYIDRPEPILGYWMAERHWGKGYMSEALAAMLDALLAIRPEARPKATSMPGNPGSIRVLEKAGLRRGWPRLMLTNVARGRKVQAIELRWARGRAHQPR